MEFNRALSTAGHVLEAADCFFYIADQLHRRLNAGPRDAQVSQQSTDLYSLLVEEYGLRARAAILRNNATAHTVTNTSVDQYTLLSALNQAGEAISCIDSMEKLRSVIAGVSTLCVGISPGKGVVVDFLLSELQKDMRLRST